MWSKINISKSLSLDAICRRLPSSPDFEYAGYLTKSRILYQSFGANNSLPDYTKDCTFHTHPSNAPNADVPSALDICSFLKDVRKCAITVGRDWIWIWHKTPKTVQLAKQLNAWELKHMIETLSRLDSGLSLHAFREQYCRFPLQAIGLQWSRRLRKPETWCKRLEAVGIDTILLRR